MSTILEALANNDLHVLEITEKRSPKRQKLIDLSVILRSKLEQNINDSDKELLDQLLNAVYDETSLYAQDRFINGYRLGTLMTTEVFQEKNAFLNQEDIK